MERKKYVLNEYTNKKSQQANVNHKNFRTEKNSNKIISWGTEQLMVDDRGKNVKTE